ncbi:hypothetical protein [Micromonospora sp. SL4-19]|uniref:hypothetical protein n=1 Tax=Micromonospora sp. SL4-19 TaxID=3399129 RepID=UPI003A4E06A9
MVAYVPTKGVRTIYGSVGDLFAWLCIAVLAVLVGIAAHRAVRSESVRSFAGLPAAGRAPVSVP